MTKLELYIRYIEEERIAVMRRALELLEGGIEVGHHDDAGVWINESAKEIADLRRRIEIHESALIVLNRRRRREAALNRMHRFFPAPNRHGRSIKSFYPDIDFTTWTGWMPMRKTRAD